MAEGDGWAGSSRNSYQAGWFPGEGGNCGLELDALRVELEQEE